MVARALRAVLLARVGEAFLIGVAGTLFTLACAVLSGARPDGLAGWVAGLLGGLLGGLTWCFEHRPQARAIARVVDTRLGQNGAFLTAFEAESTAGNPLAGLLARRVAMRVGRRDVARVALPRSMPWVALPFLGAAFLGAVLEVRRAGLEADLSLAPLMRTISSELEGLRPAAFDATRDGSWTAEQLERLLELDARARALSTVDPGSDPGGRGAEAAASGELEALFEELEALRVELPPTSALARELDRVAAEHRGSAGQPAHRSAADGVSNAGRAEGAGSPAERANPSRRPGSAAAPGATPGGSALAGGRSDGTMSGRSERLPDPTLSSTGLSAGRPVVPRGLLSGRWWPAHHAGVVERWAEIRRRELERRE